MALTGLAFANITDKGIWDSAEKIIEQYGEKIEIESCLKLSYAFAVINGGSDKTWETFCLIFVLSLPECYPNQLQQMSWTLAYQHRGSDKLWSAIESIFMQKLEDFDEQGLALIFSNFGQIRMGSHDM